MPGKHAPASSRSFLISLGTAIGGALAALGVVVGIALVALNAGSEKEQAQPTVLGSPSPGTPTPSPSPSPSPVSSPSPSPSPSPAGTLTPVAATTLRILNGTDRAGLARQMAARAKAEGYPDAAVGNTENTAVSTVFYRRDGEEEAEEFRRRFPEFTEIAPAPSSFGTDVMLTVVIGADYPAASPSPSPA